MRDAHIILREHGVKLQDSAPGRYYTTCPRCSANRSKPHQENKVLGVTIDAKGAQWGCNHCGWTGGELFNSKANGYSRTDIVGTYDYVDENGELLFQVCRKSDKTFPQRSPDGNGGWVWSTKDVRKVLYRLPELIEAMAHGRTILIAEGEKDVDNLWRLGTPATCNPGGASEPDKKTKWRPEFSETLRGADIVILPDHDAAGYSHAEAIARISAGIATRVRVLKLAEHWPSMPAKGDVSDWLAAGHTREELDTLVEVAPDYVPDAAPVTERGMVSVSSESQWSEPKSLPDGLPSVAKFELEFLPISLVPWVGDISERMQCPPDYVAVTAITALGSLIGRRVGIKPMARTDWMEVPNMWGMFIGRPGMLKSPAMNEALKAVHRLEAEAAKENEKAMQAYKAGVASFSMRKQVAASLAKEQMKKQKVVSLGKYRVADQPDFDCGEEPEEPQLVRYRTNDSSYEAIGELLIANPSGILIERDEIVSLLRHLDRDDQAVARGFYLSGWSGTQPYTFDRIIRGHRHIEAVCISVVGNTQPSRICEYVRRANADGAGGDGLLQRFSLMVWPDEDHSWRNVDEYPNSEARETAWRTFMRLGKLAQADVFALGAGMDAFDMIPSFRFEADAQADFIDWRSDLEQKVRSGAVSPVMEGHLAKFRKLVPSLALINHLVDATEGGSVGISALRKAIAFANYLETHASRVYGAGSQVELAAGRAILVKIRNRSLPETGFTARDIVLKGWASLTETDHFKAGLDLLADLDHLATSMTTPGRSGGRPSTAYTVNPRTLEK